MSRWHNCPNMAAFWCNTITLIFYLYVIYTAGIRYNYWKISASNPRYGLQWNERYLFFYLICILTSCVLWILMFYSSIFKTGNYANDYVNFRKSLFLMNKNVQYRNALDVLLRIINRIKYHLSPFSCIVHVIGAYCLILPLNLFVSEQKNHDIINKDYDMFMAPYVPEIINLLLALMSLTIRGPSLFVSSCPQLGISISLYLFVASSSLFFNLISSILYPSPAIWCNYHPFILLIFLLNTCFLHEAGRVRLISRLLIGQAPKLPYLTRHSPSLLAFSLWFVNLTLHICMYASRSALAPWWVPKGLWLAPFTVDFSLVILHQLVWLVVWLLLLFKTDWVFRFDQVNLLLETEESHKSPNPSFIICPIRGDPNYHRSNQQQLFCSNKDGADSFTSDSLAGQRSINFVGSRSTPYGMDSTTVYTCFHANNNLLNDPDNLGNSPRSNDAGHLLPSSHHNAGGSLLADGSVLSSGANSVGNHSSSNTSGASIPPPPASSTSKSSSSNSSGTANLHPHYHQSHNIRYTPTGGGGGSSKTRTLSPSELMMNNPDEIMMEENGSGGNYGNYSSYGTHSGNYEDINTISGRHSVNPSRGTPRSMLNDICEEKTVGGTNINMGTHDYFRSPNISQRSSTMPSGSDSGIGGVVTTGTLSSRNMLLGDTVTKPHHAGLLIDEQQNNLCSDV